MIGIVLPCCRWYAEAPEWRQRPGGRVAMVAPVRICQLLLTTTLRSCRDSLQQVAQRGALTVAAANALEHTHSMSQANRRWKHRAALLPRLPKLNTAVAGVTGHRWR